MLTRLQAYPASTQIRESNMDILSPASHRRRSWLTISERPDLAIRTHHYLRPGSILYKPQHPTKKKKKKKGSASKLIKYSRCKRPTPTATKNWLQPPVADLMDNNSDRQLAIFLQERSRAGLVVIVMPVARVLLLRLQETFE